MTKILPDGLTVEFTGALIVHTRQLTSASIFDTVFCTADIDRCSIADQANQSSPFGTSLTEVVFQMSHRCLRRDVITRIPSASDI